MKSCLMLFILFSVLQPMVSFSQRRAPKNQHLRVVLSQSKKQLFNSVNRIKPATINRLLMVYRPRRNDMSKKIHSLLRMKPCQYLPGITKTVADLKRPFFVVSNDARSCQWLKTKKQELLQQQAIGLMALTNGHSVDCSAFTDFEWRAANTETLATRYHVSCYPALLIPKNVIRSR